MNQKEITWARRGTAMDRQTQGLIYGGELISDGPGERLSKHVTFPNWLGSTETGSVHSYIADEDAWRYSLQQYEEVGTAFAPQNLRVDLPLAQNYQNALPGSREHRLRLLEVTAASVNALAGIIYASFHPDTQMKPPKPPEGHFVAVPSPDHCYVDFYQTSYDLFENYPFGLLNVVGYWAEAELFGGVVLLERGRSGYEIINAFLHPQKETYAFQLLEKQLNHFADLGIAGDAARSAGVETVLPLTEESDARTEFTFARAGGPPLRIYKNLYDQQPLSYEPEVPSCVMTEGDPRAAATEEMMTIIEARR